MSVGHAVDREPLTRGSQYRGKRIFMGTRCYHAMVNDLGYWYLCGCAKPIRGLARWSPLRRNARKSRRWGER